jgi:superfamily II DNA or RNA helicase
MAAPYQHLVDQWKDEAEGFGYRPILAYQSQERWRDKLQERVYAYNHGDLDAIAVITTHATFASEGFQNIIATLEGPVLLIADEVHHLGARNRRKFLAEQIPYRLALSATPDRWFDDVGTGALRGYFDQTVFELTLGEAIGLSLTPYYYHPVLVELTEEEMEDYRALSIMIARMFAKGVDEDDEKLGALLRKRSGLLNNAANKIEIISQLVDQQKPLDHALFYCAPGGQINDVMRLLGLEKRLLAHRFTAHEDTSTRRELLARFDNGDLQALVAMNCLDEGVDVPSTRTAFILASSGNPRQFIQRRGRVLRKYPGKEYAVVYDLIAVPPLPDYLDRESVGAERSILRRELKRFVEFADSAQNTQQAYDVIWDLADQFEILDFE